MNILKWTIFIFFSVAIGLYPLVYVVFDMSQGLFASKAAELLQNPGWQIAFYQHIFLGGIALLVGWIQFSKKMRARNLALHRLIGKVYVISVMLSGSAGLYIAYHASGGIVAILGFSALAIVWLFTTLRAYQVIQNKDVDNHQYWMIRSYALCWAAVTLRLWIPLFQISFNMEFLSAYRIIAWLCWVPNLIVAEVIIATLKRKRFAPKRVHRTIPI